MKNIKKINFKEKSILLRQINAHFCKVEGPEKHKLLVWEILSYEKVVKLKWKTRPEKVTFSMFDRRGDKFLCGLIPYVTKKLNEKGYTVDVKEIKINIEKKLLPKIEDVTFEDYQNKIVRMSGKSKRGIFVAPTGSGKSLLAAGIIIKHNIPVTLVTTINKTIFNQLIENFTKWFPDVEIGKIGDGVCEVSHITVGLYQSVIKYDLRKFNKLCQLYVADECHSAAKSITKILKQLSDVHYRYGFTATPQREENKDKYFEMVGNIGPILEELSDDVVSARVVDCDLYMVNYICKNPMGKNYHAVFRDDICCSFTRNTKLLKAAKSLALDKDKTVLFLVDEISQAKAVKTIAEKMGIKCSVAHGKNKSGVNDNLKDLLNDKKINMVIATGVMRTGTDIPSLDCLVLGSARKSEISIIQGIGRSRRSYEGKEKAIIIDSFDRVIGDKKYHEYFEEYSEIRLELYKEKGWFRRKLVI